MQFRAASLILAGVGVLMALAALAAEPDATTRSLTTGTASSGLPAFPGPAAGHPVERIQPDARLATHPEILLRRAYRAEIAGDSRTALAAYEKYFASPAAAEQDTTRPSGAVFGRRESAYSRAAYGRLLALNRRTADALTQIERAIDLAPKNSEYAILKAEVLRRAKRDEDALDYLSEVLYRYEDDPGIEFLLGELRYDARDFSAALGHHTRVLVHLKRAGSRSVTYRNVSLWRLADMHLQAGQLGPAAKYLERYLRFNPRRHYPRFILADRIYYSQGRFANARRELQTLLGAPPAELLKQSVELDRAYGLLARIYYFDEDARFVNAMRGHAAYHKTGEPAIVERALLLAHRGEEREALQFLLPIVQRQQNRVLIPWVAILRIVSGSDRPGLYAEQLTHVAAIASEFGQHRRGLAWLREAESIKRKHPDAPVSFARMEQVRAAHYEGLKQTARASLALRDAVAYLERRPKDSQASAESAAKPAAEIGGDETFTDDPAGVAADLRLTHALLLSSRGVGRYAEAYELAVAAGETSQSYAARGEIEFNRRRLPAAEAAFGKALDLAEAEARAQQADERIRKVLQPRAARRARLHFLRAVVLYDLDRTAAAVEDLTAALELRPNFGMAANFLAYIYGRENRRLVSALRLIDGALEREPVNAHYLDTLALIELRRGELLAARYQASFAVRLQDDEGGGAEPEMIAHLGEILAGLGRDAEARSQYDRARVLLKQRRDRPEPGQDFDFRDEALLKKLERRLARPAQ